jgi:hypothetical protein
MPADIARHTRNERLPADSGEWLPVSLQFKRLPPPPDERRVPKLIAAAILNAVVQVTLLSLLVWAVLEFGHERDLPSLMLIAPAVGITTSAAFGARIAHRHRLDVHQTIGVLIRAQAWWSVLVLIPCYGWGALVVLGLPCIFGTFFGAAIGARLGRQKEPDHDYRDT